MIEQKITQVGIKKRLGKINIKKIKRKIIMKIMKMI